MVPTNPELAGAQPGAGGGRHRRAAQPLRHQLLAAGLELSGYLGRTVSALVALAVLGTIAAVQSPPQSQEPAGVGPSATNSAMADFAEHRVR